MDYKYLIAYLGQHKISPFNKEDFKLINIRKFEDYTPQAIEKLTAMRDAGEIDSAPAAAYNSIGSGTIEWYNKEGQRHRLGGPSLITKSGIGIEYFEWCQNGKFHRVDGPARLSTNQQYIEWYLDGKRIAVHQSTSGNKAESKFDHYFTGNLETLTKEQYVELIKKNFPLAGDRVLYYDYLDETD